MANADGMYGMFFGILDNSAKKGETVAKQKTYIMNVLETGVDSLMRHDYTDAKDIFAELIGYLKISEDAVKKNKCNFTEDIPFFTSLGYCYSFLMMDDKKDKKEEEVVQKTIQLMVKQTPKRQIVKFLELLSAYKKELWGECLYLCEKLQNTVFNPVEESSYKCPNLMNKHAIAELDAEYCKDQIENIQEAAMYGYMEKLIKVEKSRAGRKPDFTGLNWIKLWSPELNERVMKRLRSFKKPMNEIDIHKVFHGTVLPLMYGVCCPTSKSLYFYFKQEYMFKCEECLRARVQYDTRYEVIRKMAEENISHHGAICNSDCDDHFEDEDDDLFSDDDAYDDNEDDCDFDCDIDTPKKKSKALEVFPLAESKIASPKKNGAKPNRINNKVTADTTSDNSKALAENTCKDPTKTVNATSDKTVAEIKVETKGNDATKNENENKNKTDKNSGPGKTNTSNKKTVTVASKIMRKEKEIQTDKLKISHRYCQTEVPKYKNFGVQIDLIKNLKPELVPKSKHFGAQVDLSKCSQCSKMEKSLNDALKDNANCKNSITNELKELKILLKEHGLNKEAKLKGERDIIGVIQILERIERNQNDTLEKFKFEKEDQICKNNFLQKLLLDQVNEKYCIYKEIYAGLEKKCQYFIRNVAKLHNYLSSATVPTLKENNIYLNRWQKTLSEIECQNKELKVFYKKTKTRMINLNQFEADDWPQIAEIPVEALAFIFDSLQENAKLEKVSDSDDLRESVKPIRAVASVRIVTPTDEMRRQNKLSASPASSVESYSTSVSQISTTAQPIINVENKYSNIQLRPAVPQLRPYVPQFSSYIPQIRPLAPQLGPVVSTVQSAFRPISGTGFPRSNYQPIPMPPSQIAAIRPNILPKNIQEMCHAPLRTCSLPTHSVLIHQPQSPTPQPQASNPQKQVPISQPQTPSPERQMPTPLLRIQMPAPLPQIPWRPLKNTAVRLSLSHIHRPQPPTPQPQTSPPQPRLEAPTPPPRHQPPVPSPEPEPHTPTPEPESLALTPEPEPHSPAPESEPHSPTPEPEPQASTPCPFNPDTERPPTTIFPAEFYRNFPPPPLPANFPPQKSPVEYNLEEEAWPNLDKSNKENVPENRPKTYQRNTFHPKFNTPKSSHRNISENTNSSEDTAVKDDVKEKEPSEESGSGSSSEGYLETQRKPKIKLRNVDENGREITVKREHSDKEIFAFLQQHCSDLPEEDLINAILTVMSRLKDSFGNLPKQDVLKQVKAALPPRAAWKSTNLPVLEWKSDTVDTNCSICFEDLSEQSIYTLPCKHEFHKDCIKEWLQTNSVCPICRVHSIFDEDFPPLM